MTTFRRGKIARLQRPVREELNRRLDGEPGTGRAKGPAPEAGTRVEPGESNQNKPKQSTSNKKVSRGREGKVFGSSYSLLSFDYTRDDPIAGSVARPAHGCLQSVSALRETPDP